MPGLYRRPPQPQQRPRRLAANEFVPFVGRNSFEDLVASLGASWMQAVNSSDVVYDAIGSKTPTTNGTPTFTDGPSNLGVRAVVYANVANFHSYADHPDFDLTSGFSVGVAFRRITDNGSQAGVLRKGTGAYAVNIGGSAAPNSDALTWGVQGTGFVVSDNTDAPIDGNWHLAILTYSGTGTGNQAVYLDGVGGSGNGVNVVDGSQVGTAFGTTTTALEVGKDDSTFDGYIAYVFLIPAVLTGTDVTNLQTEFEASAGETADAENASGTGTAYNATTTITAAAGNASGTGTAYAASVNVQPNAGNAAGTGTAYAPSASVAPTAGNASGTGTAYNAGVSTTDEAFAELASGTGTAHVASANVQPTAGNASGTGTAYAATTTITAAAGHASGTGTAHQPSASVAPSAGLASGTGTAYDTGTSTTIGHAAGTGSANQPSVAIAPVAGHASGTGTAYDATVSTASSTDAAAGHASGTGQAFAPSVSIAPVAGNASGTGSAHQPSISIAPVAGHASGTGAAHIAGPSVAPTAGHASGTGAAYDATVSTSSAADAAAGHASGTGTAYQPSASIAPIAGHASGTGEAYNGRPDLQVYPGGASGTGTAYDATATATGGSVNAQAGHASGTGTAYDATISGPVAGHGAPRALNPWRLERIPKAEPTPEPVLVLVYAEHASGTGTAYDATTEWNDDETVLALLAIA